MTEDQLAKDFYLRSYKKFNRALESKRPIEMIMNDLSHDEIESLLITCDGVGKEYKKKLLDEQIQRATQ